MHSLERPVLSFDQGQAAKCRAWMGCDSRLASKVEEEIQAHLHVRVGSKYNAVRLAHSVIDLWQKAHEIGALKPFEPSLGRRWRVRRANAYAVGLKLIPGPDRIGAKATRIRLSLHGSKVIVPKVDFATDSQK